MSDSPTRTYRVGEFATIAGVTTRALHHYDRLGLVTPRRTSAGYRVYVQSDLERLAQVVALKYIGIPLKKIGRLLATDAGDLAAALRGQRLVLEERRQLLDQAIVAIQEAERVVRSSGSAAPELCRKIIEVIQMQDSHDWNTKYQQLVDAKIARLKALTPEDRQALGREWAVLVEDIRAVMSDDPASPKAQALANRWLELLGRVMGTPVDRRMATSGGPMPPTGQWGTAGADQSVWEFMQKVLAHE